MRYQELLKSLIHHRGDSYRNIYTVSPSQSLYDDILDESEYEIAEIWEEKTSSIEYSVDKIHRPFQYGEKENSLFVFDNINPGITRFSDGNFGVWYGALEELTSLIETYYWIFKEIQPDLKNARSIFTFFKRRILTFFKRSRTSFASSGLATPNC